MPFQHQIQHKLHLAIKNYIKSYFTFDSFSFFSFVPKNLEPIEDKEDELLDVKFPNPLFHQVQLLL